MRETAALTPTPILATSPARPLPLVSDVSTRALRGAGDMLSAKTPYRLKLRIG